MSCPGLPPRRSAKSRFLALVGAGLLLTGAGRAAADDDNGVATAQAAGRRAHVVVDDFEAEFRSARDAGAVARALENCAERIERLTPELVAAVVRHPALDGEGPLPPALAEVRRQLRADRLRGRAFYQREVRPRVLRFRNDRRVTTAGTHLQTALLAMTRRLPRAG